MTKKTSENAKELPNGWEWKTVGEVTLNSKTKNPEKEPNQTFQYLDISSIDNINYKIIEIKELSGSNAPSRARKVAMKYDTVFATTRPNLKNIAIIESDYENLICSTGFSVLKAGKLINYKYLFLFFISENIQKQIEPLIRGSQYPAISDKDVLSCQIPLPPLKEQERIVQKLDTAFQSLDEAITLQKENIAHTQELKKAVLVEQITNLSCEMKKLGEVAEVKRGKSKHRPRNDKTLFGGEYPFIQTGDVRNAHKYLTEFSETYNEKGLLQSKLWKKGTICLTIAANIGDVAILGIDACFPDSVVGIYSDKNNTEYIYYILTTLKQQFEDKATKSAQMNLNVEKLVDFEIPLPSLPEQERIVAYLDASFAKLDTLIVEQQERLAQLTELKKSILQEAFEGKL